ncbi:hypothetical protein HWI79_3143 [Cryptosporidium felis]|nr:hypothetical protein HWI79_3143 [Cryptosporidium felis]
MRQNLGFENDLLINNGYIAGSTRKEGHFIYQVNRLNNILFITLLICHIWHNIFIGGDITPNISILKLNSLGILGIVTNVLLPSLFFVQGWLKALEIHSNASLLVRLHFEYLFPILIFLVFYLMIILFYNDAQIDKLTIKEFTRLLSSYSFNPGFLVTLVILFMINLFMDSFSMVVVPIYDSMAYLQSYTVNISLNDHDLKGVEAGDISSNKTDSYTVNILPNKHNMDDTEILKKRKTDEHATLRDLTIVKFIYCLFACACYDNLLLFMNEIENSQIRYFPTSQNCIKVLSLFIMCKIFKKSPKVFYYSLLIIIYMGWISSLTFDTGVSFHFSERFLSSIHFLSLFYLTGLIFSCINIKIYRKWTIPTIMMIYSILCQMFTFEYSRVIISPLIFPSVMSIKSKTLTFSQIFSGTITILYFSLLVLNSEKGRYFGESLAGFKSKCSRSFRIFTLMVIISIMNTFYLD